MMDPPLLQDHRLPISSVMLSTDEAAKPNALEPVSQHALYEIKAIYERRYKNVTDTRFDHSAMAMEVSYGLGCIQDNFRHLQESADRLMAKATSGRENGSKKKSKSKTSLAKLRTMMQSDVDAISARMLVVDKMMEDLRKADKRMEKAEVALDNATHAMISALCSDRTGDSQSITSAMLPVPISPPQVEISTASNAVVAPQLTRFYDAISDFEIMRERLGDLKLEQQEQWERRMLWKDQDQVLNESDEQFLATWELSLRGSEKDLEDALSKLTNVRRECDEASISTPSFEELGMPEVEAVEKNDLSLVETVATFSLPDPIQTRSPSPQGELAQSALERWVLPIKESSPPAPALSWSDRKLQKHDGVIWLRLPSEPLVAVIPAAGASLTDLESTSSPTSSKLGDSRRVMRMVGPPEQCSHGRGQTFVSSQPRQWSFLRRQTVLNFNMVTRMLAFASVLQFSAVAAPNSTSKPPDTPDWDGRNTVDNIGSPPSLDSRPVQDAMSNLYSVVAAVSPPIIVFSGLVACAWILAYKEKPTYKPGESAEKHNFLWLMTFMASVAWWALEATRDGPSDGKAIAGSTWLCLFAVYQATNYRVYVHGTKYFFTSLLGGLVFASIAAGLALIPSDQKHGWNFMQEFVQSALAVTPAVVTGWTWLVATVQRGVEDEQLKRYHSSDLEAGSVELGDR